MGDFLFGEFDEVSAKQWKQKIQVDLKGADYHDNLLWKTEEGITVKPFYHQDEFQQLPISARNEHFSICQSIFISDEKTANFLANDALHRGASAIEFEANTTFDIDALFKGLKVNKAKRSPQFHFKLNFLSEGFLKELISKTSGFEIYLNLDPILNLTKTGRWFYNHEKDHVIVENILRQARENTNVFSVDTALYQNAGANIVQQVTYALAHANEYLNHFNEIGNVQFHFAIGGNYFFEIAKLRAFRYLWKLISREYTSEKGVSIFTQPSSRNKTLYDYNVNMLRTTTECMSAILGGANTISNLAYDSIYHKKNEFGERIARNQLLILQEESYFEEAAHFANGSYYIETLTYQIAEKALALFKDIELSGGFLKQLSEGTIQRKIQESARKEQEFFDKRENVLLGTNKYINEKDKMKGDLELYPFVKTKSRQTSIEPIIPKRLAEKLEQVRLEKEKKSDKS